MKLLPAADLDRLLVELEVDIVTLSECVVSPERALVFPKKKPFPQFTIIYPEPINYVSQTCRQLI